jgi:hypothetical protein
VKGNSKTVQLWACTLQRSTMGTLPLKKLLLCWDTTGHVPRDVLINAIVVLHADGRCWPAV